MTTFGGNELTTHFNGRNGFLHWREYLSIAPASNHPLFAYDPMYRTLTLENHPSAPRAGYVKVSEVYSMDWQDAQPFWKANSTQPQRRRLDDASLATLLSAVAEVGRYSPEVQYDPTMISQHVTSAVAAPSLASRSFVVEPAPIENGPLALITPPAGPRVSRVSSGTVTTPTAKAHPRTNSFPAVETPISERQPLLPSYHERPTHQDGETDLGFFGWLWAYLKKTRLGVIIHFVSRCGFL